MSEHYVTCERTGKQFPRLRLSDLKVCVNCRGYIDIRHEPWLDGPLHSKCPEPAPVESAEVPA
jgi:hypothetical protein